MTSAAVVSFPTVGGVISKSLGRIAGSLLGAIAALLFHLGKIDYAYAVIERIIAILHVFIAHLF